MFEDKKYFYFVQEYLSGSELLERFSQMSGNFGEDYVRMIMEQVLSVIKYLHSQKCCHRDIKAENFVFESPDSNTIKIIDFGFSSQFINSQQPLLKMKTPVGTLLYAAPEVFSEGAIYTEKCDVWSAGNLNIYI